MRLAFLLLILGCLFPFSATAAALKRGDVVITDDGAVIVAGKPRGKVPLPPGRWSLRVRRTSVQGQPLLHLVVDGQGGRRGEFVATEQGDKPALFAGLTGPQGVDAEWSRRLSVGPERLTLHQGRADAVDCEGQPIPLFAQIYDFTQKKWKASDQTPDTAGMPELLAKEQPPDSWVPPLNLFRPTFASTQAGDRGRADTLQPPRELADGSRVTAWQENRAGDGRGALLTFRAPLAPYPVAALAITPTAGKTCAQMRRTNRAKRLVLTLKKSKSFQIVIPVDPIKGCRNKDRPVWWVTLPKPVPSRCLSLTLHSVYRAHKANEDHTALAEVTIYSSLDIGQGRGGLVKDLASSNRRRADHAVRVAVRLGGHGVTLLEPLIKNGKGPVLWRVAEVLVRSAAPGAPEALARLVPRLTPALQRSLAVQLADRGPSATPTLITMLNGKDSEVATEAARQLSRMSGPRAVEALIGAAGRGTPTLREAVCTALSRPRGVAASRQILQAMDQAGEPARKADLLWAAGRAARATDSRENVEKRSLQLIETNKNFGIMYRAVQVVGLLRSTRAPAALMRVMRSDDPLLRRIATSGLAAQESVAAVKPLITALTDPDPAVRAAAAAGLETRPGSDEVARALAASLLKERWGEPALWLTTAVAHHCSKAGVEALRQAMRHGPRGHGVDGSALAGLAHCRPRGLARFLLATAAERSWRVGMRERALSLLDRPMARALGESLLTLYKRQRRDALRSELEEKVAVAAARALAVAGTRRAAEALADTVALEPIPSLRLAATLALGKMCHQGTAATLKRARQDAPARVRAAAAEAVKRCGF